jgi:hypothetical protein
MRGNPHVRFGGAAAGNSPAENRDNYARRRRPLFDEHSNRPLYLGRTRRIASPDQRVVLYAKDRGCTAPGCDVPGYWSEVHHVDDWATGGRTDIDKLTFACAANHKLAGKGWTTRKLPNGQTEWIPPPRLDHGQRRTNDYHHPERLFDDDEPG